MREEKLRRAVLVTARELHEMLATDVRVVVLDVRWSLAEPDGRRSYSTGHIPGAHFVDLERDLAGPASPHGGRHPLPDVADLQESARGWGIDDGDPVVVYDDTGGTAAARAWWLLRWAGLADVRILDGGLHAWSAEADGILEDGEVRVPGGTVVLSPGHMPVVDADAAAELPRRGVLLDARAGERYRGEVEPMDSRAGHVPGAVNLPTADTLDEGRHVRPEPELVQAFAGAGIGDDTEVAVYCGSGVTAAHEIAVLETIGVHAALFPGSWSQWSADAARPVATGVDRGDPDGPAAQA